MAKIHRYNPKGNIQWVFIIGFLFLITTYLVFSTLNWTKIIAPLFVYGVVVLSIISSLLKVWEHGQFKISPTGISYNEPQKSLFLSTVGLFFLAMFSSTLYEDVTEGNMLAITTLVIVSISIIPLLLIQLSVFKDKYWIHTSIPLNRIENVRMHWEPVLSGSENDILEIFLKDSSKPIQITGFSGIQCEDMRKNIKAYLKK